MRKLKLTQVMTSKLCDVLRKGANHEIAFRSVGICSATFYRWLALGEKGDPKFIEFSMRIRQAEAEGALAHLDNINKFSMNDWKCSAWLLERKWKYSKNTPYQEPSRDKEDLSRLSPSQLLQRNLGELREASKRALNTGSFQAFSALKRQELNCMKEMKLLLEEQGEKDEFSDLTDHQLLIEIEEMINSLPAVYRQKFYEGK